MIKQLAKINYFFFFFFLVFLFSFRGYEKENSAETIWLEVLHPQKKINYYLEADSDGKVLMREIKGSKIFIRRGTIKKIFFKDFFREIKNSDVIREKQSNSKMMFYKGEMLHLSAYIDGELRRINSPMYRFSEAFKYAFNALKKEVYKIEPSNAPVAFISCAPLEGIELENFKKKVAADYQLKLVETKKLRENLYVFNSINQPYRMLIIKNEDELTKISDFISDNKILGMISLFYIGTTRGNFQCSVIK